MVLTFKNAPNFQDLGYVQAPSGQKIAGNRLFRSQALTDLPNEDLKTLQSLDFGLVCDLRSLEERREKPNSWLNRARTKLVVPAFDPQLSAVRRVDWIRHLKDPSFDRDRAIDLMIGNYCAMPKTLTKVLAEIFKHCETSSTRPLLVHCTAGKDRTGFVVALLLWAIDMPYDVILENFLKSGEIFSNSGRVQSLLSSIYPEGPPERAIRAAEVISSVNAAALDVIVKQLQCEYGSIDNYLTVAAGLSKEKKNALRKFFFE